jgi:hypothetical protein
MFANTQMMGTDLAFPDVCLPPAGPAMVPIPYPNIAMGPTAIPSQVIVNIMAMPVHKLGTTTPMTNGNNAGVGLGVASGLVMGPSRHLTAAFTVLFAGMPATRLTSMSLQNSTNAPGARLVPSQPIVLLLAP